MSLSALATYSDVPKPGPAVAARSMRSTRAWGIGSPVSWCSAKRSSTSGVESQCSRSWEGNST